MKTGSGMYDYTPEQIDQLRGQRAAKLVAVRKALEAELATAMKVWLLDNGSIVIEHTQLMWNVPGPQVRIPVVRRARRARRRALPLRHRLRPRAHERRAAVRAPRADAGADDPRRSSSSPASQPSDVTTLVNSHLHFDHVGGNKHFSGIPNVVHEQELAQARDHEPFEFFGYSDKTWDHDGATFETGLGGRRARARACGSSRRPGHTIGHYSLLVSGGRRHEPMLFAFDVVYTGAAIERGIQPGFHIDPRAGVRSIQRVKDVAAEHGADVFFSHDPEAFHDVQARPRLLRALGGDDGQARRQGGDRHRRRRRASARRSPTSSRRRGRRSSSRTSTARRPRGARRRHGARGRRLQGGRTSSGWSTRPSAPSASSTCS